MSEKLQARKLRYWLEEEKAYLRKDLKLTDASEAIPVNRTYLSRIFNRHFKCSFSVCLLKYRLEESKRLLVEYPELMVCEVAERSGFRTQATFYHAFKQHEQQTPGQYRKLQLKHRTFLPKG
ncbi:helix-turn-helix domain-containing protein [Parabacteroides sp. PF5-6]|uniref:helix-turn-helix domain-containing protein n=1 Tax=Parabacteroides sp. PF5-6 TaxID=1742403 RepID=UPI002405D3F9|nr:helix-turn-helix domain-containing protein [Parabacteroides sp. PF5-6]MDF9830410.1 AraC-like DNA-binding protein [Parabacteroides sp. PF5-6]